MLISRLEVIELAAQMLTLDYPHVVVHRFCDDEGYYDLDRRDVHDLVWHEYCFLRRFFS